DRRRPCQAAAPATPRSTACSSVSTVWTSARSSSTSRSSSRSTATSRRTSPGRTRTDMTAGAQRVDVALVARGLVRSRTLAQHAVRDGRVLADGTPVTRASHPVDDSTTLCLLPGDVDRYVSRAGHKLAGALAAIDALDERDLPCPRPLVDGASCLDVG